MAGVLKLTCLFQDNRSGWSETYYFAKPANQSTEQVSDAFVKARRQVLGSGAKIIGSRIGDTSTPRIVDAYLYEALGTAEDGNGKTATIRYADSAQTAVLMPIKSASGVRRFVTLSSFPDAWMERTSDVNEFYITSIGAAALDAFKKWLLSAPYPLQIKIRDRTAGNPILPVNAITVDANGRYQINTAVDLVVVAGTKITLTKLHGNNVSNARGVRKVITRIDASNFTIDRGPRQDLGLVSYTGGAMVQKVQSVYEVAVNTAEPYQVTSRKRGRPFAARRGRRSVSR